MKTYKICPDCGKQLVLTKFTDPNVEINCPYCGEQMEDDEK